MKNKKIKKNSNLSVSPTFNNIIKENILYFLLVFGFFLYFIFSFFSLPDFTNPYLINNSSWIVNLEIAIDIVLFFIVAYCGYCYIKGKENIPNKYLILFVFISIAIIHLLAFNSAINIVGDNADYINNAKSIATRGGAYSLYLPGEPPNSVAFGYPLLLSFIYLIFGGINILAFKIFTMLLSLLSIFIFYQVMLKLNPKYLAIVFTILYGIHCYVLAFSSMIMTETPTLFWSIFTWYFLLKFCEEDKFNWKLFIGLIVTSTFTYLTRYIGVSIFGAVILYLLATSKIRYKEKRFHFDRLKFKKFIYYLVFIFTIFFLLQLRGKYFAGSYFFSSSLSDKIDKFIIVWKVFFNVLSENIFPNKIIRYLTSHLFVNILIQLVFYFGLVICLLKKNFASFYYIGFVFLLSIATPDSNFMPISRYLVPLTPFFIYVFYFGFFTIFKLLGNKLKYLLLAVVFFHLIFVFQGNASLIQRSHTGEKYNPAIANYFECGKWINKNLPDDIVVESRKNRLFYLFAERISIGSVGYGSLYNQGFEDVFLKRIKNKDFDYLVLDGFSSASWRCYYQLIQRHPQYFQLVKVFGDKNQTYLFKIIN